MLSPAGLFACTDAFDQYEKAWIVLAPSLDMLCKEMRAEAKRSAPKIKAETDIEVKRLSKSMRVKKGTFSALTRRLRELEASSSEEESKSTESRSSNESDSDRGSDSDDSDSSVVDVPLAKAVPVVVEPKKKRKSTVVDSSDDDAPPAKRSKTKMKRKSSAWKFIADEAEASDMESDSEELRANDADHAFLDDNRHDDDEVQEIPRMPGKQRKRRLYQKTKATKSRKQVGGEPWTQETNSRHISKTEKFPTKDSVIRDLFKEAPKMSNAKAEKKAEKKARKRKRSKHEGDTQRQVSEAPKGKLKKKVFTKKIKEKTANVGHRVSAKADDKSTQKQSKKVREMKASLTTRITSVQHSKYPSTQSTNSIHLRRRTRSSRLCR